MIHNPLVFRLASAEMFSEGLSPCLALAHALRFDLAHGLRTRFIDRFAYTDRLFNQLGLPREGEARATRNEAALFFDFLAEAWGDLQ